MIHRIHIITTILLSCSAIYLVIWYAPDVQNMGKSSRLLYLHVPLAMCAVISFVLSGIKAVQFLRKENVKYSIESHAAVRVGMLFTVLTTITGAVWAKVAWGVFWNWDPRESSIVFLLLVYVAYFALSKGIDGKSGENRVKASYLLIAAAVMPFFVFVIPRIYPSLHPDSVINPELKIKIGTDMRLTLLLSVCAFVSIFALIYRFEVWLSIREKHRGLHNDK